ncbi:MAG: hypothetical protein CMJ72_03670 [Planctomycetaceae bacterium]|nr:hypothetical protein [Planctomycetaceae bacterium]HCK42494.1 hypothetical protein [Planctomycetaceae bacterium]
MPSLDTYESLQASLEPLKSLRGEQSQLESWVNESFHALEKLHGELTDWQSELARKQTELDLREDNLEKCHSEEQDLEGKIAQWKEELGQARSELQLLEEENTEQLQELEKLERRQALLEAELKVATQRTEEISATLAAERAEATEEKKQWRKEFSQMRLLLEKHCSMLASHLGESDTNTSESTLEASFETDAPSRIAALRRRAQSRRAAKKRNNQDNEEKNS